jgi:hypothetical protein
MRQERTVQASLFDLLRRSRERPRIEAISQWLDKHRELVLPRHSARSCLPGRTESMRRRRFWLTATDIPGLRCYNSSKFSSNFQGRQWAKTSSALQLGCSFEILYQTLAGRGYGPLGTALDLIRGSCDRRARHDR